jgi:DNA-binding MarR family transcriptional regulator
MDKIDQLDTAISTLLRVLIVQERRIANDRAALPFNPIDIETLSFLARTPGAVAKQVATYLQISATTMQSVVDRLEKRGLLTRDKAALKGRAIALALTSEGGSFRERIQAQNIQNCTIMLEAIDPLDQERFVDSMTKIAAKFSQMA